MAIGIVSDDEFDMELEKIIKTPTTVEIIQKQQHKGRGDNPNVPDVLRNIIGESHITDSRQDAIALAASLGISHDSADAYGKGATSLATYHKKDSKLNGHLNRVRDGIRKRASSKLAQVIENVTGDKMKEASLRELTGAARDLAGVVKDMTPPAANDNPMGDNVPKFVLYAPQFVNENRFETIVVNE